MRGHDHAGPGDQREPELQAGDVEGEGGHRHQHVVGAQAGAASHGGQEVDQRPVGNLHAFGPPRRARGVDDVGHVVGAGAGEGRVVGGFGLLVHPHDPGTGGGQTPDEAGLGEDHRGGAVGEHEGDPFGGEARIQRHVGAARVGDCHQGRDHVRRALQEHTHQHSRPHAGPGQAPGQAPSPVVELGEGQGCAGEGDRPAGWGAGHLSGHQRGHAHIGKGLCGVVPRDQNPVAFGRVEPRYAGAHVPEPAPRMAASASSGATRFPDPIPRAINPRATAFDPASHSPPAGSPPSTTSITRPAS